MENQHSQLAGPEGNIHALQEKESDFEKQRNNKGEKEAALVNVEKGSIIC